MPEKGNNQHPLA